jgi:hypothetical protein
MNICKSIRQWWQHTTLTKGKKNQITEPNTVTKHNSVMISKSNHTHKKYVFWNTSVNSLSEKNVDYRYLLIL